MIPGGGGQTRHRFLGEELLAKLRVIAAAHSPGGQQPRHFGQRKMFEKDQSPFFHHGLIAVRGGVHALRK